MLHFTRISQVAAIPRQQDIYAVDGSNRKMKGVPDAVSVGVGGSPRELWTRVASVPEAVAIVVGALVFVAALTAVWRLEDRPSGLERRLLQLLRRDPIE